MLAADMRTGKELILAQEIREVASRLDFGLDLAPIDRQGHGSHAAQACLAARWSATGASCRR
jgi:hypothetical protein